MTVPPQIGIRIDVLEVEGLNRSGAFQFQRAVERELARLVSEKGLPPGMASDRSIDAINLDWHRPSDMGASLSAERLARRIYEGLDL